MCRGGGVCECGWRGIGLHTRATRKANGYLLVGEVDAELLK